MRDVSMPAAKISDNTLSMTRESSRSLTLCSSLDGRSSDGARARASAPARSPVESIDLLPGEALE